MKSLLSLFLPFLLIATVELRSQTLTVNAGSGSQICPGTTLTIGGTPTVAGGTAPYTYAWSPTNNLSSSSVPNPIASPPYPTWYYVNVTDAVGNTGIDSILVDVNPIWAYNAGNDTSICIGSGPLMIGGIYNNMAGGVTYTWSPSTNLDNINLPRPTTSTTVTITYDVTITSPSCPTKTYSVTITVNALPVVDAQTAITINEGQSAILTGYGGVNYGWFGDNTISDPAGNPVTVEPVVTTQYLLVAQDANGCYGQDTVTVTVHPSSELYFYNTFSPNNDTWNDYFYIGNIAKYPNNRIEIYTRTGQQVYAKTGYMNEWDGTNYGDKLPEATYYYVLDLGDGSPKLYKSVTIVR